MKRPTAATITAAFFLLVLLSQTGALTAQVTPLATPGTSSLVSVSPLRKPYPFGEPNYNPHPKKITPRAVPFVDKGGETIVKEYVIERPYQDPILIDIKATPTAQPAAASVSPLTFQSPLGNPTYKTYLPVVTKAVSPNAQVLVIAYLGSTPNFTPTNLAQLLINHIGSGTSFHKSSTPAIMFEMVGGAPNIVYTTPPTNTDGSWNLWTIYNQFNICNRVASEGIDEVWIYVDGLTTHPGYGLEWQANGPIWKTGPSGNDGNANTVPPNCGKQMFTMGLSYDAADANELESWVHSAEVIFTIPEESGSQVCDFSHIGYYGMYNVDNPCHNYGINYSAINAFTVMPDPPTRTVGVCGDAHFPPNTIAEHAWPWFPNPYAYIYNSPETFPSRCADWQWTITNTVPVSGGTWGNTEVGYLTWWMQNIPGLNNNLHGRNGSLRPNWWDFRLHR
jgi:hypothetical protein